MDVLCAYIRMPYDPDPTSPSPPPPGENEVRFTIIKLTSDHLQEGGPWAGNNFNFRGATFDGGNFFKVAIGDGTILDFTGATFVRGMVSFMEATFSGGAVKIVDLSNTKCDSYGKQVVFFPLPVPSQINLPDPPPDCFLEDI